MALVGGLTSKATRKPTTGLLGGISASAGANVGTLQNRVNTLEQRATELGGGFEKIEERPGIFGTLIDLLSRPNFAVAGAVDELVNNNASVGGAAGRALSELFSGIGNIEGQKEDFGKVLKDAGMGTTTLGELVPFLDNTWVGRAGSRGALGLALDIGLDPITYLTLGTGSAARPIATNLGRLKVNKIGQGLLKPRVDDALAKARAALGEIHPKQVSEITNKVEMRWARDNLFNSSGEFLKGAGKGKDLLAPSAIRWLGRPLVEYDTIKKGATAYVGRPMVAAMEKLGVADVVLPAVKKYGDGAKATFIHLLHPFGDLGNAPKAISDVGIDIIRKNIKSHGMLRTQRQQVVDEINDLIAGVAKNEDEAEKIGKVIYDNRANFAKITDPEIREIAVRGKALVENLRVSGQQIGIIPKISEKFRASYLPYSYKNSADEWLETMNAMRGGQELVQGEVNSVNHTLQRLFVGPEEAAQTTKTVAGISKALSKRGLNVERYPELVPNYNFAQNLQTYVDWHTDASMRKAMSEDLIAKFGKKMDQFDLNAHYDLAVRDPLDLEKAVRASLGIKTPKGVSISTSNELVKSSFAGVKSVDTETLYKATNKDGKVVGTLRTELDEGRVLIIDVNVDPALQRSGVGTALYQTMIKNNPGISEFKTLVGSRLADGKKIRESLAKKGILDLDGSVPPKFFGERAKIDEFFGKTEGLRSTAERLGTKKPTGRPIPLTDMLDDAELTLRQLSDRGKREFFREMFTRMKSANQFAEVMDGMANSNGKLFSEMAEKLGKPGGKNFNDWSKWFPKVRGPMPGDVDPAWSHYGVKAAYTVRGGGIYGKTPVALPKIIADQIEKMPSSMMKGPENEGLRGLLRGYDWINNTFKTMNYAIWPGSAVRDLYNNIAQNFLDVGIGALDPKTNRIAGQIAWANRKIPGFGDEFGNKIIDIPENGLRGTAKEIRELSQELGVTQEGSVLAQVFGAVDPKTGKAFGKSRAVRKGFKKGKAAALNLRADIFENQTRNTLWVQHMRRGLSPREAAERVRQALFDYSEASDPVRRTFLRIVPFGQFILKNTEFQARMLATQPGRVINQIKPFRQDKDDTALMTKWESEALAIGLNKDGKTITTITGIDLPLRSLDNLWSGSGQATVRRLLGTTAPLIKAPLEFATGTQLFTGSQYPRSTSNSVGRLVGMMPKDVRAWMGYKKETDDAGRSKYTLDAVRYNLLWRSWLFSRVISTSDRGFREYADDPNMQGLMLDLLTGLRHKEIDLDEQQEKRLRSRVRILERALIRRQGRISTKPREGIQESL